MNEKIEKEVTQDDIDEFDQTYNYLYYKIKRMKKANQKEIVKILFKKALLTIASANPKSILVDENIQLNLISALDSICNNNFHKKKILNLLKAYFDDSDVFFFTDDFKVILLMLIEIQKIGEKNTKYLEHVEQYSVNNQNSVIALEITEELNQVEEKVNDYRKIMVLKNNIF